MAGETRAEHVDITVKADGDLTREERGSIAQLVAELDADTEGYVWATKRDWRILVTVDGQLVGHVAVTERTGAVGGQPVRLAGISDVETAPPWRGRGLARAAMARAAALMCDELHADFGLLFCKPWLVPFYERLGWHEAAGPTVFDQPGGKATYHLSTMVLPCGSRELPIGTIDLCGLPW